MISPDDLRDQALAEQAAGRLEPAAESFLAAFAEQPDDWRLANEAGNCLLALARYGDAERAYDRALDAAPHEASIASRLLFNKGLVHALAGATGAAIAIFEGVLTIDPTNEGAHIELAQLCEAEARWEDAIAHLHQALALNAIRCGFSRTGLGLDGRLFTMAAVSKARIYFLHLDRPAAGLVQARWMLRTLGSTELVRALADDLTRAGRPDYAAAVLDLVGNAANET